MAVNVAHVLRLPLLRFLCFPVIAQAAYRALDVPLQVSSTVPEATQSGTLTTPQGSSTTQGAQCQSYGIDYQNGGSYFTNKDSSSQFTVTTQFSGKIRFALYLEFANEPTKDARMTLQI